MQWSRKKILLKNEKKCSMNCFQVTLEAAKSSEIVVEDSLLGQYFQELDKDPNAQVNFL
jgi:hypothetical protein